MFMPNRVRLSTRTKGGRRAKVVIPLICVLGLLGGGAGAAGLKDPKAANPGGAGKVSATRAAKASVSTAGKEWSFVSVPNCLLLQKKVKKKVKVFSGINKCAVPDIAVGLEVNLAASGLKKKGGSIFAWGASAPSPAGPAVYFDDSGPAANQVTIPLSSVGQFKLNAKGKAKVSAYVVGYYLRPLYVSVMPGGAIYQGASGVLSTTRTGTGAYEIVFERSISNCAATASDEIFVGNKDVSPDVTYGADDRKVTVLVTDATDTPADTYFNLVVVC